MSSDKTYVPIVNEFTMAMLGKFMPELKFIEVKGVGTDELENDMVLISPKQKKEN